ncbi:switch-associated protein 70-like [Gigantopelta aegis]|uniref:switch-associated protein 70-like n=1 Tax=Gigantopelta aegis TaxID=1735272 RepID=UPI001B88D220|nr:switch-associated protein 70-like [Gigantopelta aegis]
MAAVADVEKCVWHAFDALDCHRTGIVQKSSLKVLSNNIGQVFGLLKSEEILDSYVENTLEFSKFFSILKEALLTELAENESSILISSKVDRIQTICWTVCMSKCLKRRNDIAKEKHKFSDDHVFKLWKLFNFLADVDENDNVITPVRIDTEEGEYICSLVCRETGLCERNRWRKEDDTETSLLTFVTFLDRLEMCFVDVAAKELSQAIHDIFDDVIFDRLKQGPLEKYGNSVTKWKERWFVLTSNELKYYPDREKHMQDLRGTIRICHNCKTQPIPDKAGSKLHRFVLKTPNRQYELSAPDLRSRNEWLLALQKAISFANSQESFQRRAWHERKKEREVRRRVSQVEARKRQQEEERLANQQRQLEQEQLRHLQDQELLEKQLKELEAERKARVEVEARLKQQAEEREAERQRLKELEEIHTEMEKLLETERQAKRDEEIVRNLQSRILKEEFEKREEMESLKREQDELLEWERLQRENMEKARHDQDMLLEETKRRLLELEREKESADKLLQVGDAIHKLKDAEDYRVNLNAKLKAKEIKIPGLARLVSVPDPEPFVTHRGKGAFSESEFTISNNVCQEPKSPDPEEKKPCNTDPEIKESRPKKNLPGRGPEVKTSVLDNGKKKNGDKKLVVTQPICTTSSSYKALQAMIRQCSRDDTDDVDENIYNNEDIIEGEKMCHAADGSNGNESHNGSRVNGLGNSKAMSDGICKSSDNSNVVIAVSKLNGSSSSPSKVINTNGNVEKSSKANEVFHSVVYLKKDGAKTGTLGNNVGNQCNGTMEKQNDEPGTNPFEEDQDYEEIKHVPITEL